MVLCYLIWTGVLIGLAGSAGLWVITRLFGDGSETSSVYETVADNALWLLVASLALAVVGSALSWWVDRTIE